MREKEIQVPTRGARKANLEGVGSETRSQAGFTSATPEPNCLDLNSPLPFTLHGSLGKLLSFRASLS